VNEQQEATLLANVKSLTDHMTMVDEVFKKARLGVNMVLAFQCGHSGLYYPANYVKDWGREYGTGLGPNPVSECLDTDYEIAVPRITPEIRSIDQIMHPVGNCCAQMDYDLVEEAAYMANRAVLAKDDPFMEERADIIRGKQMKNPKSRLPLAMTAWTQARRG